jgi:hypothetical protein
MSLASKATSPKLSKVGSKMTSSAQGEQEPRKSSKHAEKTSQLRSNVSDRPNSRRNLGLLRALRLLLRARNSQADPPRPSWHQWQPRKYARAEQRRASPSIQPKDRPLSVNLVKYSHLPVVSKCQSDKMRHKILEEMGFVGKRQLNELDPEIVSAGMLTDFLLIFKQKQLGNIPDLIREGLATIPEVSPAEVMALADKSLPHHDLEDDMEQFWIKLEKRE